MLEYIGIDRSMLPALHGSGEAIGEYSGMTVVTGAMDQVAGAIGAGVVKTGMISEMTGTAMTLFVPLDTPPSFNIESAIPCHYNFDGSYALVLWTPVAGMALKWFRDQLCEGTSYDELGKMAELIKPGSESLLFLPYLCGSTVPTWNPDARGVFYGLSLGHTRGHFVRAILESVAYLLKSSLEYLGLDAYEIRSMGGAAKSDIWSQIKANVTQKRIVTLQNTETASLGAAMLAATGVGAFASVAEASFAQASKVYLPDGTDYTPDYERFVLLSNILDRKGGI